MKFEWLIVRPGVIALSGTPIQVRREKVSFTDAPGYAVYEGDRKDNEWASLESAKNMAMRLAEDLFGLGIIHIPLHPTLKRHEQQPTTRTRQKT